MFWSAFFRADINDGIIASIAHKVRLNWNQYYKTSLLLLSKNKLILFSYIFDIVHP